MTHRVIVGLTHFFENVIEIEDVIIFLVWLLLIVGIGGVIWRIFRGSTPQDISNVELYRMLSNDVKWLVGFQTAILVGLLLLIVPKM